MGAGSRARVGESLRERLALSRLARKAGQLAGITRRQETQDVTAGLIAVLLGMTLMLLGGLPVAGTLGLSGVIAAGTIAAIKRS